MNVRESDKVRSLRYEVPWNAESQISFTELGKESDVRPFRPLKAFLPMVVTVLGIMVLLLPNNNVLVEVSIKALQPLRESYLEFSGATSIEDSGG